MKEDNMATLRELFNSMNILPAPAIDILGRDKGLALSVCRRALLPKSSWFKLWDLHKSNPSRAASLVGRNLEPDQIEHCIDSVLKRSALLAAFLDFNDVPKDKLSQFKEKVNDLPPKAVRNFLIGESLTPSEGYDFIHNPANTVITDFERLMWYAFSSSTETPTDEILDFIKSKSAEEAEDNAVRDYHQNPNDYYAFLLSRRSDVLNELLKLPSLNHVLLMVVMSSTLLPKLTPTVLNQWIDALPEVYRSRTSYWFPSLSSSLLNADKRPDETFFTKLRNHGVSPLDYSLVTVERLDAITSLSGQKLNRNCDKVNSYFLRFAANKPELREKLFTIRYLTGSFKVRRARSLTDDQRDLENFRTRGADAAVNNWGVPQLNDGKSFISDKAVAFLVFSLFEAESAVWETLFGLLDSYPGTVAELAATCKALS